MVGLGAALFGFIINLLLTYSDKTLLLEKFVRLVYVSLLTASISSLILGIITIFIVYHSWKLNFDPDNIATPLAAAMGDTVTLFVFYSVSTYCPTESDVNFHHYATLSTTIFCFLPYLLTLVNWKEFPGWMPMLSSMVLSSLSGWILKKFIFRINYLATLQPLVNGVGGNIASIFCSALSTECHLSERNGEVPYTNTNKNRKLFGLLIIFGIIIHFVLLLLCNFFNLISFNNILDISFPYLCTIFIQITILLFISKKLINILWNNKIDPDNGAIPLVTGCGDLLGTLLLALFLALYNRKHTF
uniref:Slc41a-1 n=1 Tax=Schmidtea mediterranea TaxID=79327 RepID=A0A0H3YFC5_SCHMD|nr:slc41a-1 [Schmidtea mediterranea]